MSQLVKTFVRKGLAVLVLLALLYGIVFCVGLMYGLGIAASLINALWGLLFVAGIGMVTVVVAVVFIWAIDTLIE